MARKKKQSGGYLTGPSHEQGGIPATLQHGGEIELEGGEYIINAQTVNAVGTEFLDELNSTATSYHQGGYNPGQLPSPSNYRKGGKVRRKKQYGGSVGNGVRTNLQTSGGEFSCETNSYPGCGAGPDGTYVGPMHYHPDKGYMVGAQHSEQPHPSLKRTGYGNGRNTMRKGGKPRRQRRRYEQGGHAHSGTTSVATWGPMYSSYNDWWDQMNNNAVGDTHTHTIGGGGHSRAGSHPHAHTTGESTLVYGADSPFPNEYPHKHRVESNPGLHSSGNPTHQHGNNLTNAPEGQEWMEGLPGAGPFHKHNLNNQVDDYTWAGMYESNYPSTQHNHPIGPNPRLPIRTIGGSRSYKKGGKLNSNRRKKMRRGGRTRKRKYQTGGHTHSMPITSIEHYHQQTDGPITSGMTTAVPTNPINDTDGAWPGGGRYLSQNFDNPYPVYANTIGTGTGGDTFNSFPTGHTGDHNHPGRLGNTTRTGVNRTNGNQMMRHTGRSNQSQRVQNMNMGRAQMTGMNGNGMNGNGPGPSTAVHPSQRKGPLREVPYIPEPLPPRPYQMGGATTSHRGLVYDDTGSPYTGHVNSLIHEGGYYWTTESGVKTSNSRKVVRK